MTGDAHSGPARAGGFQAMAPDGDKPVMDQAFDGDSLYVLREAVAAHASQAGLPEGRVVDLVLAVHELAANAVRHGAGHGRLRVWNTGGDVRCEIADGGPEPAPPDGPWPVERGHGLWLVRQVADRASLNTGPLGTVAAVSFASGPSRPQPFGLAERRARGCVVLTVTGPLDLSSAGRLAAVTGDLIAGTRNLRLILDLAGLTGWDSTGLAALVAVQQRVSAAPAATLVLAGLPGHLAGRLGDAGLAGSFTLARDTDQGVALVTRRA